MKFHPQILLLGLVVALVLSLFTGGCRKTLTQEEQEEMLGKCRHVAEAFEKDLQRIRTDLLPLLGALHQPRLVGRLKEAVHQATEAQMALVEALKKVQGDALMSEQQAGELTKVLKQVQAAQHTLRDVMEDARRKVAEQMKRRPKPA